MIIDGFSLENQTRIVDVYERLKRVVASQAVQAAIRDKDPDMIERVGWGFIDYPGKPGILYARPLRLGQEPAYTTYYPHAPGLPVHGTACISGRDSIAYTRFHNLATLSLQRPDVPYYGTGTTFFGAGDCIVVSYDSTDSAAGGVTEQGLIDLGVRLNELEDSVATI